MKKVFCASVVAGLIFSCFISVDVGGMSSAPSSSISSKLRSINIVLRKASYSRDSNLLDQSVQSLITISEQHYYGDDFFESLNRVWRMLLLTWSKVFPSTFDWDNVVTLFKNANDNKHNFTAAQAEKIEYWYGRITRKLAAQKAAASRGRVTPGPGTETPQQQTEQQVQRRETPTRRPTEGQERPGVVLELAAIRGAISQAKTDPSVFADRIKTLKKLIEHDLPTGSSHLRTDIYDILKRLWGLVGEQGVDQDVLKSAFDNVAQPGNIIHFLEDEKEQIERWQNDFDRKRSSQN